MRSYAQVTNPQASDMMQEGQQAPTNVAAQQQEGVTDGTSVVQPETAGRQSEGSVVRSGGPENGQGFEQNQQGGNASADGSQARQNDGGRKAASSRAERAQRARNVIEKHPFFSLVYSLRKHIFAADIDENTVHLALDLGIKSGEREKYTGTF
jgi:hypothetical protein